MSQTWPPRACIVCMGNELVADDGIAIRVGRALRRLGLPPSVRVEFQPHLGLDLIDLFRPGERFVLVDAMQTGAPPGTCRALDLAEVEELAGTPFCCHAMGLPEVLTVVRRVAPERLPTGLSFVGVEAAILDRFDPALSPEVAAALPGAVETVLRLLDAPADLVERGRALGRELSTFVPDPLDVPC
jgi:hydrogenase maturation protease